MSPSYHVIVKTKNFVRTKSFFKTSKRNPIMLKKQINQKNITLMEYFDYYDIVPIKIFFTLFYFYWTSKPWFDLLLYVCTTTTCHQIEWTSLKIQSKIWLILNHIKLPISINYNAQWKRYKISFNTYVESKYIRNTLQKYIMQALHVIRLENILKR